MRQKLITRLFRLLSTLTGKRFLYIEANDHNALGKTAAWCDYGFWYVGDVYDSTDLAYGVAYNGTIEKHDAMLVDTILSKLAQTTNPLVVYDIGANTGFYGILAAMRHNATVHSFEPMHEHVRCLNETVRINNVASKITVHEVALGAHEGIVELSLAGSGSSVNPAFLGENTAQHRMVPLQPLDALEVPHPHFIKIDVEGYEWDVLQGAQHTIAQALPICFIEIAHTLHSRGFVNPHVKDIFDFFAQHGYQVFLHTDHGLILVSNTMIPDGAHMYLCVPGTLRRVMGDIIGYD